MVTQRDPGPVRGAGPGGSEPLTALPVLSALRADLDRLERELIDAARREGASWLAVSRALGLRSRQAAEQRWQRLRERAVGDVGRQRKVDDVATAVLRHEVVVVETVLAHWSGGGEDPPGAGTTGSNADAASASISPDRPADVDRAVLLARRTLSQAREAPAGALHDLARLATDDLRRFPVETLGRPLARALSRLATLATLRVELT